MISDYHGTPIEVGSKVAYNYSGQVRMGRVTRIFQGSRHGWPATHFKVRPIDAPPNLSDSTITNPYNLLVIPEGDQNA